LAEKVGCCGILQLVILSDMLVNIITVCYNSEKTIEKTIQSVINQDYVNKRYIIIDGGSTDNTLSIIAKYKDQIAILVSEKDRGIYDAMNKGISNCKEGLVAILNSDDVFANKSVLKEIVEALLKHEALSVYGDLVVKSGTRTVRYWKSGKISSKKFLNGWMPPHPSFFCMKQVYDLYGKFNTKFKQSADYEFMLRVLYKNAISIVYLPKTLIVMQAGGASNASLKNRLRANGEDRLAWRVNGLKQTSLTAYLKPIRKIIQFIKLS
jgi:glycosyltransferase involved in cell wall biosynthesis